jgi:hypothetical protein
MLGERESIGSEQHGLRIVGTYQNGRVPRSMSGSGDELNPRRDNSLGGDEFQSCLEGQQVPIEPVADDALDARVAIHGATAELVEDARIAPELVFFARDHYAGVWEGRAAIGADQSADVISVRMREDHHAYVFRRHSVCGQPVVYLTRRWPKRTRAGVQQDQHAARVHNQRAGRELRTPEGRLRAQGRARRAGAEPRADSQNFRRRLR